MKEYEGIEYHSDRVYGERHAAINVKIHAPIRLPEEHESFSDRAWESVQEQWWEEAHELARASGYDYVFCEGRLSGWLVPIYQPAARRAGRHCWPGQGPDLGYPVYPDMDKIGERSRFRAFQRKIHAMLKAVPQAVIDETARLAEEEG